MKSHNKPKIGIGFFGIPRASGITIPNILKNLITPAQKLGETTVRYHFYLQKHVFNPSTNENCELAEENYTLFNQFEGILEDPAGITERYGIERVKSFGDAWNNNYQSLNNLILQLHSLQQVTLALLENSPDIVIFARPDLIYHDSMEEEIASALRDQNPTVRLPNWQWGGGYNDRFSICGRDAIRPYGLRIMQIDHYLERYNAPLHSEKFLQFVLDTAGLRIEPIKTRASRVRTGGIIHQEKFKKPAVLRRIRWQLRELRKQLLRKSDL